MKCKSITIILIIIEIVIDVDVPLDLEDPWFILQSSSENWFWKLPLKCNENTIDRHDVLNYVLKYCKENV